MIMIMDIKSFNNQHDCHYPVCTYMPAVSNYWPVMLSAVRMVLLEIREAS